MSKTLLYLAILAILGFGVWFFLFSDSSGKMFRSADASFTVRDTGAIGKIFLSHNGSGKSVLLERKPQGWVVDKQYPILQSMLRSLLITLNGQQALHPIPDESREAIIRSLAGDGIKVELYDRNGEKMRIFYVGGELHRFSGTAMLMDGSERPFAVQIPGFEGYLTPRYAPDLKHWRDRIVFDIAPEQISRVSVRYAQEPLNSFTLTQQGGKISVSLDSMALSQPLNEACARSYLKFFTKIYAEGFLMNVPDLDSIVGSMPQKAVVAVEGQNGYRQTASIFYYPRADRDVAANPNPEGYERQFNADRYFAIINNGGDTVSVPIASFEKIFRRGYEFFIPDELKQGEQVPGLPNSLKTQPK